LKLSAPPQETRLLAVAQGSRQMSKPVNRALVEELLADESLSYKEIARQADCSDWSVRSIDRERSGGPPMKTPRGPRHVDESESKNLLDRSPAQKPRLRGASRRSSSSVLSP
jgi:hypothetical protein